MRMNASETPRTTQPQDPPGRQPGAARTVGLGLITGAADDDPSAIGTYASAGARFGYALLWMAPVMLPMTFVVVYLSSKLAMVSGRALFDAIRAFYPRWVLYPLLVGVIIGNVIEAAADLGGMAAALHIFLPVPIPWLVAAMALAVFALQCFAPYHVIRNTFRWLALALLAYVGAALLAKPDLAGALRGTFVPRIEFTREYLELVVAVIGTAMSAYLYTWQSNQEVEEEIAKGRHTVEARRGATVARTARDPPGHRCRHARVQPHHVLHHAGHRLDAACRGRHGDRNGRPGGAGAAADRRRCGPRPVRRRHGGRRPAGRARDDGGGRLRSRAVVRPEVQPARQVVPGQGLLRPDRPWSTAAAVGLNFLGFNPMRALVWAGWCRVSRSRRCCC